MAKQMLKGQSMPTKKCRCGRGDIFTRQDSLNPKIDGVSVCEECMVEHIRDRYALGSPAPEGICLECGNNIGGGEEHWSECSAAYGVS